MTNLTSDANREHAVRIVALFTVLIHGWQANDPAEAARARSELQKLGVIVKIQGNRVKSRGGKHV